MPATKQIETPGERIRAARERARKTQVEVSILVGVAPARISDYECGRALPCAENLVCLSDALGVSIDHILKGAA